MYLLAFVGFIFIAMDAHSQDYPRGKALHDKHCMSCHDTRVYTRDNRAARDYGQIRAQVVLWQKTVSLHWDEADIDQVTGHLASGYYGIQCPEQC
jgi:hypothetical protein